MSFIVPYHAGKTFACCKVLDVTIGYYRPSQQEYFDIVINLAKKYPEIKLTEDELRLEANKWELSHGGISGRTAQQFINHLIGVADN